MRGVLSDRATERLARREPLVVDPSAPVAIKRNVHEFWVEAPADAFAEAFRRVLAEPGARFGPLEIKRQPRFAGTAFSVGERFQAGFSLEALAQSWKGRPAALERWLGGRLATRFEEEMLSDYAEICVLTPRQVAYRYLTGSPIAGHSTFTVTPQGHGTCHLETVFLFQEKAGWAVEVMHRFAAAKHDEVTVDQVRRAAASLGVSARTTCRQALDWSGVEPTLNAAA